MARKYRRRKRKRAPSLFNDIFYSVTWVCWRLMSWPFFLLERKVFYALKRFFRGKSLGKTSLTERGEIVKSATEKRIADFLYSHNIQYIYEKKTRVWFFTFIRPDFYLPDFDIYIEYFGLLNHPTLGKKYREHAQWKKKAFARLRKKVIYLDHRHRSRIESELGEELARLGVESGMR